MMLPFICKMKEKSCAAHTFNLSTNWKPKIQPRTSPKLSYGELEIRLTNEMKENTCLYLWGRTRMRAASLATHKMFILILLIM